ncbi:hypothetical protein Q3G72_010033 [Acer saccharum]|nr:hypothetical protein Q3G72_010033 [Acer saccharum]
MAVLRGIRFALVSGLVPFVIETDALNVGRFIRSGRPLDADVGSVINEILVVLDDCSNPSILFASRKVNSVAHRLAKMALSIDEDMFWLEFVPPYAEMLVLGDYPG